MRWPTRPNAAFAVLAGIAGVVGSFAVAGYTRRFVVAPIDALVVRLSPGAIVAWLIQNVGEEAHLLHIGLSAVIATGLLAGAALVGQAVARRGDYPFFGAGLAGVLGWGVTVLITGEPLLAVGAAVPVAVVTGLGTTVSSAPDHSPARRRVLRSGLGVLGFVGLSVGVDRFSGGTDGDETAGTDAGIEGATASAEVTQRLQQAESQSLDFASDDLPGLVSPIKDFYGVDINEFDPEVPSDDWSMTLTGEVESDVTVTFAELTDRPTEHRYVTLRCVGEPLNGKLLDNAVWTGTPLKPLLEAADPNGECGCAMLRAEDDYFVQFPVDALEDAFLAWGMNGQPLPKSHGHPVRVLVPGHWGETNVKWLSEIELLDEEVDGYWERRGWHGTGPVSTVAKLWDTTALEDGRLELGGHAYAGTRGIDRVEVSTDGGDTWNDAELSEPLPGDDVWRQWRYLFEPNGAHDAVVRAVDGEGAMQVEEASDPYPSGATGWVRETVER
ncbi:molybdopterin-dependent oxidoreductase [Halobellus ordinarius]|uniref:molybdopterin-dependent oxidoreductase n=1 Tax=Halobellus ordinarius TaxID=3075120 RepID=UPI00287FFBCD|nr:molybdopterin-dependent oxidoreductase [Halobellus sp. ZY16]